MKRALVIAVALATGLAANACRRIVDLTPLRDSGFDGNFGADAALADAFAAFDDAGVPGDVGHD